jgi:hypothetical protein
MKLNRRVPVGSQNFELKSGALSLIPPVPQLAQTDHACEPGSFGDWLKEVCMSAPSSIQAATCTVMLDVEPTLSFFAS